MLRFSLEKGTLVANLKETKIFNQPDVVVESWYWGLKSKDLKSGQVKALNFLGKDLAIFRGEDGIVRAMNAYCPHMGAHLAEGKVDRNGLRCFFHAWKFDGEGNLVDIPCRKSPGISEKIETYPVKEKYGVIWIFTGTTPTHDVHTIPELKNFSLDHSYGNTFIKECHPNVVMINAIDAHHFTSVHNLPVEVKFKTTELSKDTIQFENCTFIPKTKWYLRLFRKFYSHYLTYNMVYTAGSTGSVTVGPDFLHCHIIFALRPTPEGKTEGLTILLTKKRTGIVGMLVNPIILFATKLVGNYFAKGDTEVFKTIKFKLGRPIKEDESIIKFMHHLERQTTCLWGQGVHVYNLSENGNKEIASFEQFRDPESLKELEV